MQPPEQVHRLVDSLAAALTAERRGDVSRTLAVARNLADHNEWGVALELLCDNLYEYAVPLSGSQYSEIERLAVSWGVDRSYVEPLKELLAAGGAV